MNPVKTPIHSFNSSLLACNWVVFNFDLKYLGSLSFPLVPVCARVAFEHAKREFPGLRGISVEPGSGFQDYLSAVRKHDAWLEEILRREHAQFWKRVDQDTSQLS